MEKFRIWIKFEPNIDDQILDTDWCGEEQLKSSLQRLLHGPVSKMNILHEVMVVDTLDRIVFLAQGGKVVFPRPEAA
jgi:hypothetical protein